MVNFSQAQAFTTAEALPAPQTINPHAARLAFTLGAAGSVFLMVGLDDGAGYVSWTSASYDVAGSGFAGGSPTPVGSFIPGSAFALAEFK